MAEIWELERDINDRDQMTDKLRRILRNLKVVKEEAGALAANIDNNISIDDNGVPFAQRARQISNDLGGYIHYIEECIIPHLDWDIQQARIGIENLQNEE